MRLWSIHPKYLDKKGLVALWREGLLAQKVLHGETKGYKNHPQLDRFKNRVFYHILGHMPDYRPDACLLIAKYLLAVQEEGTKRGYKFDRSKIRVSFDPVVDKINVTSDQITFEWAHLELKVDARDPDWYFDMVEMRYCDTKVLPHPLFNIVEGPIEPWEKIK